MNKKEISTESLKRFLSGMETAGGILAGIIRMLSYAVVLAILAVLVQIGGIDALPIVFILVMSGWLIGRDSGIKFMCKAIKTCYNLKDDKPNTK